MDASADNCIELYLVLLTSVVFQQFYPILFVLFLICNSIPPAELKMNDLRSKINGTAVSLQIWNWYFDNAETRPIFVCSKPNLIPRTKDKTWNIKDTYFFTVAPCILISKQFIHQQMHIY